MTDPEHQTTREERFRAWREQGFGPAEAWRRADMPDVEPPREPADPAAPVRAEFLWALRRWKDSMTPEELVQSLVDAPAFRALVEAANGKQS